MNILFWGIASGFGASFILSMISHIIKMFFVVSDME